MLNNVSNCRTDLRRDGDTNIIVSKLKETDNSNSSTLNIRSMSAHTNNNIVDNYQILSNVTDSPMISVKSNCHLTRESTTKACNEIDRLEPSPATCVQLSKLTTACKITKPLQCLSQSPLQQHREQNQHQHHQQKQVVQQQRSLTDTTKSTILTTSKREGDINVKSSANMNVNANLNVKSSNKSTTTENKYLPTQLTVVSTERELKVCATSAQNQIEKSYGGNILSTKINNSIKFSGTVPYEREDNLEYVQGLQRGLQLSQHKELNSLAEHKAKLRAEFFADHTENNTIIKPIKGITGENFKTRGSNCMLKRLLQDKAKNWKSKTIQEQDLQRNKDTKLVHEKKLNLQHKLLKDTPFIAVKYQADCVYFPKVQQLVKKFDTATKQQQIIKENPKMIVNSSENTSIFSLKPDQLQQHHRQSPMSDEGCNLAQSPYCSSDEDNDSICTASTAIERPALSAANDRHKEKVSRSASSDSALGLEVDENLVATPPSEYQQTKRRMTLTVTDLPLRPALLPLAEPTALPDTPTPVEIQQSLQTLIAQTTVPSKVLLEERVVELPLDESFNSRTGSRRESAQSCLSDYPLSECSGVRYMRTPSVVVSDYSDDVMCGITLEEIEYFRAQRSGRRFSSLDTTGTEKDGEGHSDISAASSCSNLYYCGSTISALDGAECYVNGVRVPLERKTSDSSDYSIVCECEEGTPTQETEVNLTNILAAQHLDNKIPSVKKVGLTPKVVISEV